MRQRLSLTIGNLLAGLSLLFLVSGCASFGSEDKEKSELYMKMGIAQFEQGNFPYALRDLLKAQELDPTNPLVQNNLGLTYFMRERYDLAEKSLRKALELNPKYTDARNNLARVLIEVGKNKDAEAQSRIVLNDLTYASLEKAYVNLGLAQFNQSKFQEAADSFSRAIEAQRDSCVAHTYYGRSQFEMKEYRVAADALDRAVGFCQRSLYDEPHFYSAVAYYRLGSKEKSIARFEEILKLYPSGKYRDKAAGMLDLIRKGH